MQDIYQEITDRMIAELEKGRIPWHCPWRPAEWRHRNLISGKPYRGINAILLAMSPYASPFWLTMRQLRKLGGELSPNEGGTAVVFWKLFEKDEDTVLPVLRFYTVYNLEQTYGIPAKHIPQLPPTDRQASEISPPAHWAPRLPAVSVPTCPSAGMERGSVRKRSLRRV